MLRKIREFMYRYLVYLIILAIILMIIVILVPALGQPLRSE